MPIEPGTPSVREQVDAVLRDEAWLIAAQVIPPQEAGKVGRRRLYPSFVWLLWPQLRPVFRSHTGIQRELGRGGWWTYVRRELKRLRPDLPELPVQPPTRQAYEYWRNLYLTTEDGLEQLLEIHTRVAVGQAIEGGNLDPAGTGSFTHPDVTRSLYGDGTVIPPLYKAKPGTTKKDRETGKVREVRSDPDAHLHTEGGGHKVWGLKVAEVSTRRDEGRFILALEHVATGDGGEAAKALEMLRRIKQLAPGTQAVVWDMALRGKHLQVILTELGLVPIVGVPAKENPEGGKGRSAETFEPKTVDLDDLAVRMPDGTTKVAHIAARNGWPCVKTITETGDPYYEPLKRGRIQQHLNKSGECRWYGFAELPAEYGAKQIAVRLHGNEEDRRRGLNRTENLRPIPEGCEDYVRLRRLRPDAESINNGIEHSLFDKRASGKGWRRLMVDLLGHARLVNAVTLARCRARAFSDAA